MNGQTPWEVVGETECRGTVDDPVHTYFVTHEDIGGHEAELLISTDTRDGFTGGYFTDPGDPSLNLLGEDLLPSEKRTAVVVLISVTMSIPPWFG